MNYRNTILEHLKKEKQQLLNLEMLVYEKFTDKQLDELLTLYKHEIKPQEIYDGKLFIHLKKFKEAVAKLENEFMESLVSKSE